MDHGSCPYMYLVSVLFMSSIPHLTLHPQNVFVLVIICLIQILLNVTKTMVAVNRYAPTLKEAMNALVQSAMY